MRSFDIAEEERERKPCKGRQRENLRSCYELAARSGNFGRHGLGFIGVPCVAVVRQAVRTAVALDLQVPGK